MPSTERKPTQTAAAAQHVEDDVRFSADVPRSARRAVQVYCAEREISVRKFVLQVLAEKKIWPPPPPEEADGAEPPKRRTPGRTNGRSHARTSDRP